MKYDYLDELLDEVFRCKRLLTRGGQRHQYKLIRYISRINYGKGAVK